MTWSEEESLWTYICRGELCGLCEAELLDHPGQARGFQLCQNCHTEPTLMPPFLMAYVDHGSPEWSLVFTDHSVRCGLYTERERVGPWLLIDTIEEVEAVLHRPRTRPCEWENFEHDIRAWGRTSMLMVATEAQYQQMLEAGRRDPRNGYQKRSDALRSMRRAL